MRAELMRLAIALWAITAVVTAAYASGNGCLTRFLVEQRFELVQLRHGSR